jgi:hypothetical protein
MTGSYAAAGLLFLGLFLLGGAFSLFKQGGSAKTMSFLLVVCAGMSLAAGVMRW